MVCYDRNRTHLVLSILSYYLTTNPGVELTVTETLPLMEGKDGNLTCVSISENQPAPERIVTVNYSSVVFDSMYTGKAMAS